MALGDKDDLNLQKMKVKKVKIINGDGKEANRKITTHPEREMAYLDEFGAKESFQDYTKLRAALPRVGKDKLPSPGK